VDDDDVGVLEIGRRDRLLLEALHELGVAGEVRGADTLGKSAT
jgi:hypothetical protein